MIRTDNHIHTEFDHDGKGKTEEFVKSAVVRGMKHISFTMHSPCPKEIKTSFWGGKVEDMEAYRKKIPVLQDRFPQIGIGFGIELEYVEGFEDEIRGFIREYDFDYVLGSVHLIDGWMFDFDEKTFAEGLKETGINDA